MLHRSFIYKSLCGDVGIVLFLVLEFAPNTFTSSRLMTSVLTINHFRHILISLAFKSLVQDDASAQNVTVFGSSQQSVSFLRMYYEKNVGIFPHLTAVIDVKDGVSLIILRI